jgi:hypothetical protein
MELYLHSTIHVHGIGKILTTIQFFMRLRVELNIHGPITFVANIKQQQSQKHDDKNKEQTIKEPTQ